MKNNFKFLCAAAATLLATATQAAVLTLSPAGIGAEPGQTTGWGFSLFNDDASNYLLVTGSEFAPGVPSAFGSYTDLLGARADWVILAPLATLAEAYDAVLRTGIGEFSVAPSADGTLDGQVLLHYALFSADPNGPTFDPDQNLVNPDATAAARASATALPEPGTLSLLGIAGAGLLALRRRQARQPRNA
ncbi:PEP-CTERM sorting domain-containing protein [Roseateles sp. BYS78W]|uniref:PEP-CTERM sorting domain-containing protein n=1 Tax=Pelomonas candidula TaxID=3299025 RepID=A0ABW7HIV2_9BURK